MSVRLYVGNLPFAAEQDEVRDLFAAHGEVVSVKLMMDRETGRPRGFGFVEMGSEQEAQAAIGGLNGMSVGGRAIVVNVSKPKESGGGFGGGYGEQRRSY